ncbi:MAG: hypothetical protein KGI66_01375 [Patescibacteria group bacterium]|nr:hypothetical protein [Patescibacteria group bacterium]
MKTYTVTFVEASDLFTPDVMAELATLNIGTWGNNNRTLISKNRILDAMENVDRMPWNDNWTSAKIVLEQLPAEVTYIDMEN